MNAAALAAASRLRGFDALRRLRIFVRLILHLLMRQIEAEREHRGLWLVVALGAGIAVYFGLPFEPPWTLTAGLGLAGVAAGIATRLRPGPASGLGMIVVMLVTGFVAADVRTQIAKAPVIARPLGAAYVEGLVEQRAFDADGGGDVIVRPLRIARLAPQELPRRIKISMRRDLDLAAPGATVAITARLMPPPGPSAPGAFDFARRAYFQGIGAVGFAFGGPKLIAPAGRGHLGQRIASLREAIAHEIEARIEGPSGGIAVALMTGLRGAVPQQADDDLRAAGLTHLLSISGLHVSLVALALFGTLRLILVLHEGLALRLATKKWAAAGTILGVGAYVQITGASIPAERAFIMSALVLLAIILDRRALTLRNIALAGGVVLLVLPESLLDVSFQMSFAATLALVAAFEVWNRRRRQAPPAHGFAMLWRARDYVGGLALTSLVAGLATAPFSAYHFQTIALYGLLSNMIAVPLTGLVVMPALLVAYLLMPFGLAGPALDIAGIGLDGVVAIARVVADLPGAVWHVKAGPASALALMSIGGLWLCLWQTRWRMFAFTFMAAGLMVWIGAVPPDVLIARDLKTVAVRDAAGVLMLVSGKPAAFDASVWARRQGLGTQEAGRAQSMRCDALGCSIAFGDGRVLSLSASPGSLDDDCRAADILISTGRVRRRCVGPSLIVDRLTLLQRGSIAIWDEGGTLRVESAGGEKDGRPWSPQRPPKPLPNISG